jgi:hypothetical protein
MMYDASTLPRFSDCQPRRTAGRYHQFDETYHSGETELRVYGMPIWIDDIAIRWVQAMDGDYIVPEGYADVSFADASGARATQRIRVLWETGKSAHDMGIYGQEAAVTDALAEWMQERWPAVETWARDNTRSG